MERKSIGQFIAALRKANGLTQKQLAEKLHVSDKAISRWERDECAPDLSLIPVLAEIFQVTADDILRGERQNREIPAEEKSGRSEKQRERLLNSLRTRLRIRSLLAAGIGTAGLLIAMLCNFGFHRAYIGFILACVFYLAALVCEAIFGILAFSALNGDSEEDDKMNLCKKGIIGLVGRTTAALLVLLAATLPLVLLPWEPYMGIAASDWLRSALPPVIGATAVCAVGMWFADGIAFGRGVYVLSEKEAEKRRQRGRIRNRHLAVLLPVLGILLAAQCFFNTGVSSSDFVQGHTFENWIDFKFYMETPMDDSPSSSVHIDENEPPTEAFYGPDGERVLFRYVRRNQAVMLTAISWTEQGLPVITVYTGSDLRRGQQILDVVNGGWIALDILCIMAAALLCRRKQQKAGVL